MSNLHLLFSTGDDRVDDLVRGMVGIWESVFPSRVRGYYLLGSYANGTAEPSSDIDLCILFNEHFLGQAEKDQAQDLCGNLEALRPYIWVDLGYLSEASVQQADRVTVALRLKNTSQLVYGTDTRDSIAAEPGNAYVRDAMHIPYYASAAVRALDKLIYPLDYPAAGKPFHGYEGDFPSSAGGDQKEWTKNLVVIVGWIATALLALRAGVYAGSKQESADLYVQHIGDEWAPFVRDVYDVCRGQWHYQIPEGAHDRQRLRTLCEQALAFENHFYGILKTFLLDELHSHDSVAVIRALERLGQIIYPERDVNDAVQRLAGSDDIDIRNAAQTTLASIQKALASQ